MADYQIEKMSLVNLKTALSWAEREGWEPGLKDAELFYQADPNGFLKGVIDGEMVASGAAVIYDDHYGFFGLYIVKPHHRGKGLGLALTKARHAYCGNRNVGLDGVLENVEIYRRLGFEPYHENGRYVFENRLPFKKNDSIMPLNAIPFDKVSYYDRLHFPSPRDAFLKAWIREGHSLGFVTDGVLKGYGVIRACQKAYKIGPLFADNVSVAEALFLALTSHAKGKRVYLDMPENNLDASQLVNQYQMQKVFGTMRMYKKGKPDIKDNQVFGITSFELG